MEGYIVQPLMESDSGIPELGIPGRHDLRMLIYNGKIMDFFVRVAPFDNFICNQSHGGTIAYFQLNELPKQFRAIAQEIGQRIEQMRLEKNLTQQQLSDEIGLTRVSYRNLVNGKGKFENLIALLRALGRIDLVENFVPQTVFSPMAQLRMQGKRRQRAHRKSSAVRENPTDEPYQNDKNLDW